MDGERAQAGRDDPGVARTVCTRSPPHAVSVDVGRQAQRDLWEHRWAARGTRRLRRRYGRAWMADG